MKLNIFKRKISEKYDGSILGVRHIQAALMFALTAVGIGSRLQITVAIVAMTDNTTSSNPDIPTYDWTNKSVILSSFYWGYLLLQVIAGALSDRFSTKIYLLIAMTFNSATLFFVPFAAAKFGSGGVMACRILQGISQGGFFPSTYVLLGRWAPLNERSRLSAIALGGSSFGTIVTLPLVGYMSSTRVGWPSTFYLYGSLGLIWIILFYFFGADSPSKHSTISPEERKYIECSLNKVEEIQKKHYLPVKPVFTSVPFLALTLVHVGSNWGHITLSTEMPNYLSKVMKFDINSDGLLSSLPSLVGFFSSFIFAALADFAINKKYMSRTTTRKAFTMFGNGMSSLCLLILALLPADANTWSVCMLVLSGSLGSANVGGSSVNHIDLSPRYSGFIMSISNTVSNGVGMMAPLAVQAIVKDESVKSQWTEIFLIAAAAGMTTSIIYVILAQGEIQWWNFYGENVKTKYDVEKQKVEISEKPVKKNEDSPS